MAGGKETPRQKMIGMMYLVLTALLAMNVSKDILNAFVVVNKGITKSNEIIESKTNDILSSFDKAVQKKPTPKAIALQKVAQELTTEADKLDKHITTLKKELIKHTDGVDDAAADTLVFALGSIASKDNYDKPTELMIGSEVTKPKPASEPWSALELKEKIVSFKTYLTTALDKKGSDGKNLFLDQTREKLKASVEKSITLEGGVSNGVKEEWEALNFYHLPLVAVLTNLSKMQTDIKNVQAEITREAFNAIDAADIKFDNLTAEVIAPSSYILSGEQYKAKVLLIASSSTSKPKIILGELDTSITDELKNPITGESELLDSIAGGAGHYVVPTGGEGLQKWSGAIEIESPEGKKYYPFSSEYMVAKPAAAVSLDKMNVFYRGVDNPVSFTAAGVPPENLSVSCSNCQFRKTGKGKGMVRVKSGSAAKITVTARFENGSSKSMGSFDYRIKSIPDPISNFGGKMGDALCPKSLAVNVPGVRAELKNFDFDVKFNVISFDVSASIKGAFASAKSNGNRVSSKQKQLIKAVKRGGKIYIENVRAKGPDGTVRKIPGVNLKIQ